MTEQQIFYHYKNNDVISSYIVMNKSGTLAKNRYRYLNFKANELISDNSNDHRYITNMYSYQTLTVVTTYVCT